MSKGIDPAQWCDHGDVRAMCARCLSARVKVLEEALAGAEHELDAIEKVGGLLQGGEQHPNWESVVETLKIVRAALSTRAGEGA